MDWVAVLGEFGLPTVVIGALAMTVLRKERRIDELVNQQREDAAKAIATMERVMSSVQSLTDLVRDIREQRGSRGRP